MMSDLTSNQDDMTDMATSSIDNSDDGQHNVPNSIELKPSTELVLSQQKSNRVDYVHGDDDIDVNVNPCTDDSVMIGVEIFEESDLDADHETDNKLQLYSDMEAVGDSEPILLAEQKVALPAICSSSRKRKGGKSKNHRDPIRLSLEDRIKCIRMCSRYNSFSDVQKAWKQTYGTDPPCRRTLSMLNKKFQKTGSVADLVRTGRPKSTRTEEVVARVEAAISKDPSKSIRTLAKELGINQASIHRIRKEFEEKRSTLKMENKKLKDSLNDALKRVVILERRLTRSLNEEKSDMGVETLVITATGGENSGISNSLDLPSGSNQPTIIALNSSNGQMSLPSVLRFQQNGQDTIHIITLPQGGSSHQLLSLDEASSSVQLMASDNDGCSNNQVHSCTSNLLPIMAAPHSQEAATASTSFVLKSSVD